MQPWINSLLASVADSRLAWFPEIGVGWYPVTEQPYDRAYWERYRAMDLTQTGADLTDDRLAWVSRFWDGSVCDIGIGGGRFVAEGAHRGYDINPDAVAWLRQGCAYHDPYETPVDVMTFWDSLEHIHDPRPLLANCLKWAFVSIPIFRDVDHILRSKHYRPTEHCWYFTTEGFIAFMERFGFRLAGQCNMEQNRGREDILTFAFRRV